MFMPESHLAPMPTPAPVPLRLPFRSVFLLLVTVHAVLVLCLLFFFRPSESLVIFRYNAFFGVDTLSAWWQIYLIPSLSLLFVSINLILARRCARLGQILPALLLLLGSGIVSLGVVIVLMALVLINY